MPPTKRKSTQGAKNNLKKKGKKAKVEEEEEEFSDGFESPISEHHEDGHENSGSDSNAATGEKHEAIVSSLFFKYRCGMYKV